MASKSGVCNSLIPRPNELGMSLGYISYIQPRALTFRGISTQLYYHMFSREESGFLYEQETSILLRLLL